jgi:hypothetical protein
MAISFPINRIDFFTPLATVETTFALSEAYSVTETGGGEILTASYGPRLWEGQVAVHANTYLNMDALVAKVELLRQPGASFNVHQSHRRGPQADQLGIGLLGSSPTITAVAANNRDITIAGLPAGYVLTEGDMLSFSYLSSPTRYALHRVVETKTATGGGAISAIEVVPPIRPGATFPRALTFERPFCKAVIVPGSYGAPTVTRQSRTAFSFAWRQTLR